jgi:Protein of unknown function (DUF3072)
MTDNAPQNTTDDATDNTTDNLSGNPAGNTAAKDPDAWVTGDEPATGSQRSYLETLATEAGAEVPDQLSKADASKLIDELQDRSPRLG